MYGGDAFAHEAQDVAAEAFDAGLQRQNAGVTQQLDLIALEVGLDLVEQRHAGIALLQHGQQVAKIFVRHDVVHGEEAADAVTRLLADELGVHAGGALGAEGHGGTVQAAKSAMRFGSPPATARGLDEERGLDAGSQAAGSEGGEIILVVGVGESIHVVDAVGGRGLAGCAGAAVNDAGDAVGQLARCDALDEQREAIVGLAGADIIYPGKLAVEFEAHDAFAIGAAEDGDFIGVARFDEAGEGERCEILFEGGGEADDVEPWDLEAVEAGFQEGADLFGHGQHEGEIGGIIL